MKKYVDWQTIIPTTSSQVKKYLDACTQFIVYHAEEEEDVLLAASRPSFDQDFASNNIGLTTDDCLLCPMRACFFCNSMTSEYIVSNPFCKTFLLAACVSCSAEHIADAQNLFNFK